MNKKEMWAFLKWLSNSFENQFTFPEKTQQKSKDKLLTWMSWLKNYEAEELMAATKAAIKENPDFAPSPPKIESKIHEESELSPEDAWDKARSLCIEYHPQINPQPLKGEDVSVSLRKAISAVGGVQAIADRNPEDSYIPNQFIKRYKAIKKTQRREQSFEQLPGDKEGERPEDIEENRKRLQDVIGKLSESTDSVGTDNDR